MRDCESIDSGRNSPNSAACANSLARSAAIALERHSVTCVRINQSEQPLHDTDCSSLLSWSRCSSIVAFSSAVSARVLWR
eukprot:scaffold4877_cov96-Phaeocystis_antarctica.AAC.2